jgi:hypothetical protein
LYSTDLAGVEQPGGNCLARVGATHLSRLGTVLQNLGFPDIDRSFHAATDFPAKRSDFAILEIKTPKSHALSKFAA